MVLLVGVKNVAGDLAQQQQARQRKTPRSHVQPSPEKRRFCRSSLCDRAKLVTYSKRKSQRNSDGAPGIPAFPSASVLPGLGLKSSREFSKKLMNPFLGHVADRSNTHGTSPA